MEILKNNVDVLVHIGIPVIIEFKKALELEEFKTWLHEGHSGIEELMNLHGAIVFRGLEIDSAEKFEKVLNIVNTKYIDYKDGNSPRTKISGNIYTSTEYDQDFRITQHNELSYSSSWPKNLYLSCIQPSQEGGETPLADGRKVLERMDKELVDKIKNNKLLYIRNLHGGVGMGPSWQDTFELDNKNDVEDFCRAGDIHYEWKEDGGLRLSHLREGIIKTKNGEEVWFNQIDQFHPSHMEPEIYEALMLISGNNAEALPMYVCFGDGEPISDKVVKEIQQNIDAELNLTPWEKGDFLMVDNELISHGRMPFKGDRKVLVAMA
ncbi:hypothetical protein CJF12_08835 [Chryseobacterium piperi]|uniref:TauD/TfdA family dioxygenase n=1 Tax=Chryseobacterium piperi TaxID=558152 RepID=UPI00069150E2|nr:TauD/TfdA family dioxygenase [Chryseobacterium piperi]ASW74384.1 hypothetical protein CJF12_08835 [Chryseobacterium piperi]